MRVEFRLTMPKVGSWNGKWSGEGENYVIYKNLPKSKCLWLGLKTTVDKRTWVYDFGDGWMANVSARLYPTPFKRQKSDGFCGYEWMVDNIIKFGCPRYDCNIGGYRPLHIFERTKEFDNRKKGDEFQCIRCGEKLKIGEGNFDWITIEMDK